MAAVYSGIHLKLKSPGTPWENKLKLARFAFISSQCLLPNKEQVLLDWTTHALTGFYSKKVEFSQSVLEGLWCFLDDLLHSKKLHSLLSQGKNISLKLNVKQALLDRLQHCVCEGPEPGLSLSTLLSVCKGILSSPTLSSILTTKYELLAELVAKFCCLACHKLQRRASAPPTSEPSALAQDEPITTTFEVLLQVLSCYLSVQRQQVNVHRVFTVVTNQLLQPMVLLRHLLTSAEPTASPASPRLRPQLSRDIRGKMDSIVQLALFPVEQLSSYKEELVLVKVDSGKSGPGGAKGLPKPLKTILTKLGADGYCEPSLHYAVKTNALSLLFKLCLDSYGKSATGVNEEPRMLCFHFLTKLVPALDLDLGTASSTVPRPSDKTPQPESWSQALLILENLLNQVLSSDIYNVAADRIRHGEVQLLFYRVLVQILFSHAQPSIPAWYRCLKVLLGLNHLILEPELDQLLSVAWVDSDCMDSRVQRARQLLVCNLLQTYTKLHQLPRLFTELVSVVCWPASDQLRPTLLTNDICTSIKSCLLDTSPSQATEICSLMLDSIKRYIIPDLVDDNPEENQESEISGEDADMQVDHGAYNGKNKDMMMDQEDGIILKEVERRDASLKLLSHSQLLHAILFNLKTLDNASPVPLVRQTTRLMGAMGELVNTLLQLVTSENSQMDTDSGANGDQHTSMKKKGTNNLEQASNQDTETCAQWKQKTIEAALLLRYTWVEVDALFHIHCNKYTSLESPQSPALSKTDDQDVPSTLVLSRFTAFLSGEVLPGRVLPFPSKSSDSKMSGWLLKLLAFQQFKKVLLDSHLMANPGTVAVLSNAVQFILAKEELMASLQKEQEADGQTEKNTNSYPVAHWYLVSSSLPLLAPYLSVANEGCVADVVLGSLLSRMTKENTDWLPVLCGSQSISAISSQLLQSHFYVELPSLYSATVRSLTQRIIKVLQTSPEVNGPTEKSPSSRLDEAGQALVNVETLVEVILRSTQNGAEASIVLSHTQTRELFSLMNLIANLNPDGVNAEDLTHLFLVLLFVLTSTSSPPEGPVGAPGDQGHDTLFLGKLLSLLTDLLEGSNFQNVLKLIHGSRLLQATVSSVFTRSRKGGRSSGWADLVKGVQGFIQSLVRFIIIRNRSVRLNLEQFTSYLASHEIAGRQLVALPAQTDPNKATVSMSETPETETDIFSLQLLLASLTSFSKAMARCLGRSKPMDQTLSEMIRKTTAALGPIVETILKSQAVSQPASVLGQAFLVEVVKVMLQCDLSALPEELAEEPGSAVPGPAHMPLYHSFCQQILKEIHSAPRPTDFLLSSLRFLSAYYCMVKRNASAENGGEEANELYTQILRTVFTLLAADWLSQSDLCGLEPAVEELLGHLLEGSTTGQFNQLLQLIRDGLDSSKLRAGNHKEVLSAVTTTKLLSCCALPEACSRALWLIVPQIMSSLVFIVRSSNQDPSLALALTVPTLTLMTSLLNRGRGLISSPHHVTLVLGALQTVALERLAPAAYRATFHAMHEALYAVISCHPWVMVSAAPSFLTAFYRLVASVMQEGRQRGDSDTGPDGDVYLQCSMLLERMYTHIAVATEVFTRFSPFIVSQYVTELQKVTLRPDVKLHLTEGIYHIMDLCMERDIKFLNAGLQAGVREVFSELYGSYGHYYKAKRQGEDKYTAA